MTTEQFMALNAEITKLMVDTQTVVTLRLMGMSGAIPAGADENHLMMSEKPPAFAESFAQMAEAAIAGKRPDEVLSAGIGPLQTQVSSNRTRLLE